MNTAENYNTNEDLVWNLQKFKEQQRAKAFVKLFENRLCVNSSSVHQLYTNYSIHFPEDAGRQMVILPDPYAFHDTFNRLPDNAFSSTGLHIIPGNLIGKQGLYMVVSHKNRNVRSVPVPFQEGLKQIMKRSSNDDPFLPVLMKGDLREFNDKLPSMHLHRIRLKELSNFSALEAGGLQRVITEKLMKLYQEARTLATQ